VRGRVELDNFSSLAISLVLGDRWRNDGLQLLPHISFFAFLDLDKRVLLLFLVHQVAVLEVVLQSFLAVGMLAGLNLVNWGRLDLDGQLADRSVGLGAYREELDRFMGV